MNVPTPYVLLTVGVYRQGAEYRVELAHSDPRNAAQRPVRRGSTALQATTLRALHGTPEEYGRELGRQLFADAQVAQELQSVEDNAQSSRAFLRIQIAIDPSAQELDALRWELLRHPVSGQALATSERVVLSRFTVSRDWRPVQLRAQAELTALVAVSAPIGPRFAKLPLAPVDAAGEIARATGALQGIRTRTMGGAEGPLTLDRLLAAMRSGADIVYLVAHGVYRKTGGAVLFLQDESGDHAAIDGTTLAERIGELPEPPRLVVLASCESAGDGQDGPPPAQHPMASMLADAGVPAVIAMQGKISMDTVARLMPTLFRELLVDGRIDRALSVARGAVRDRPDAWMPALFCRLREGQIWYTAGFGGQGDTETVWRKLLPAVKAGRIVPILGPGLLAPLHGPPALVARRLASDRRFPLAAYDWDDLPRVNQFISVTDSRFELVAEYREHLAKEVRRRHASWLPASAATESIEALTARVGERLEATDPDYPHHILAMFDAPLYVTTTFDPLLEQALAAAGKRPQPVVARWRYGRAPVPGDPAASIEPTAAEPMVFHAFGAFGRGDGESLVLTEDDHFDYLIGTAAAKLLPPIVESALVNNALLFLGFRLTDWSFRVLFRLMMSLEGRGQLANFSHVAVQLDPEMQEMKDIERAKAYLATYFDKPSNIKIFWGSAEDFLRSLRDELLRPEAVASVPAPAPPPADDSDDYVLA